MTQMIRPVARVPRPRAVPDGYAVAGLVLSLVWLGGLGSLLGVIFTHISRGNARRAGLKSSVMAEWGNWLGCIGLAITVAVYVAIGIAAAHSGTTPACDPSNVNWPNC